MDNMTTMMMIGEFRDGGQRGMSSFQNMKDLWLCPCIDAAFGRRRASRYRPV